MGQELRKGLSAYSKIGIVKVFLLLLLLRHPNVGQTMGFLWCKAPDDSINPENPF
jgi:hypothetical protein